VFARGRAALINNDAADVTKLIVDSSPPSSPLSLS
jgi:hypothetical protein